MSCQLLLAATFDDIAKVQKYLCTDTYKDDSELQSSTAAADDEGWDDADWGWKDDDQMDVTEESTSKAGDPEKTLSWLQSAHLSVSPTSDFIAVAHQAKLVLLALKWDPQEQSDTQSKYSIVFEDTLCALDKDQITSILCVPLASQKRSNHGGPDWTCVIVGFQSGTVNIYTENGTLLLSQVFSEEPVAKIKCKTYEPPHHVADAEKHEELTILYKHNLVTIDGFSFFQSLRACRNHVTRATASGSEHIEAPPLAYKKWNLQDQSTITNHVSCGFITPNPFDHMQTASMLGGYKATIKATPPASHLYITSGLLPYAAFFYAIEGSAQPMLSDVAHAMASKLKSALFTQISAASGWLGFGGKAVENPKEKKKQKLEPATSLPMRFGLPDKRRAGEQIVLSPDNKLAAITDSFGRVMLIDILRGVAVRIWKGYRDAQVGWVKVQEDAHRHQMSRRAMFLIIYAPRRGILEVWTSQQGPRVAAFSVSKWCVLQCPGYTMMGLNNVTYKNVKIKIPQCFLIDPQGSVKTFDIPFHLALSDKNSKRARDLHLLKKLKTHLKETAEESGALQSVVIDTLLDMKIPTIRQHGIERVLQTKYLSTGFLQSVISAVTRHLEVQAQQCGVELTPDGAPIQDDDDDDDDVKRSTLDYESRALLQFCHCRQLLLLTYASLTQCHNKLVEEKTTTSMESDDGLRLVLGLGSEEYTNLRTQLQSFQEPSVPPAPKVKFTDDSSVISVVEYLGCFVGVNKRDVETENSTETKKVSSKSSDEADMDIDTAACVATNQQGTIKLHHKVSEEKFRKLSSFMFSQSLACNNIEALCDILKQCGLSAEDLISMLLRYWLDDETRILEECSPLSKLFTFISQMEDKSLVCVSYNTESPWWKNIRNILSQTNNINSALIAALIGRTVTADCKAPKEDTDPSSSSSIERIDLSEWVNVTVEGAQWTILIRRLEDLLTLKHMLNIKPYEHGTAAPNNLLLKHQESIKVSVKSVLEGGKGVIPELVAKWITNNAVLPSMLCMTAHTLTQQTSVDYSAVEQLEEDDPEIDSPIVAQLQCVQKRLPHSLSSDVLLSNCAWEYILLWSKDPEVMFHLEQAIAFIKCVQNTILQHGVCAMMWQMFISQKVSAAALLIEKVGKAPKERLCRRDVGIGDTSLEKFMSVSMELLEILLQSSRGNTEMPVFKQEDVWCSSSHGVTALCDLSTEQKDSNLELVQHHYTLVVILYAILVFSLKSVKPLSLFDTKGKSAFFKSFQSSPILPSRVVDESIGTARRQILCRILTHNVRSLSESSEVLNSPVLSGPPSLLTHQSKRRQYSQWPTLVEHLARELNVDPDNLRRHHVCELYSIGMDKLAEEVLLTVNDHAQIGCQLLLITGQRLSHHMFHTDDPDAINLLTRCTPGISNWIKSLDPQRLRRPDVPMKDTATLIGHVVNQLPEQHEEYKRAIQLVDFVQHIL